MGLGAFFQSVFPNGTKKLANTNRAYYNRGLFLIISCRSLPEPERHSWKPDQRNRLKEVFRSVESAIDAGAFSSKNTNVEKKFNQANDLLEKYIKTYHYGAQFGSYMSNNPLLTYSLAEKEDNWAHKTLQDFSATIDEKVESVKGLKKQTVNITFWGTSPVTKANEQSDELVLKCIANEVPDLFQIETAARIDTLLHRAIEYATMPDINRRKPLQELKSLRLDRSPQFYNISPVDVDKCREGERIASVSPSTPVSELSGKVLHIVPNRNSILGSKLVFDTFYQENMQNEYTNAWPFMVPGRSGKRLGNSLAVRNRTLSHSLSLLPGPGVKIPIPQPDDPSTVQRPYPHLTDDSSSRTRLNPASSSSLTLPRQIGPAQSVASPSVTASDGEDSRPGTPNLDGSGDNTNNPRVRRNFEAKRHRPPTAGTVRQDVTVKELPKERGFFSRMFGFGR